MFLHVPFLPPILLVFCFIFIFFYSVHRHTLFFFLLSSPCTCYDFPGIYGKPISIHIHPYTSLLQSVLMRNGWWIPSNRCSVQLLTVKWEPCKSILLSHHHVLTTSGSFAGALCFSNIILNSMRYIIKVTDVFCVRLWGKIAAFVSKWVYC